MKRAEVLDLWRSLAVLLMVAYHILYDLSLFGAADAAILYGVVPRLIAGTSAVSFILISGICSRFSENGLRRGFFVFCVGGALSVVMAAMGMPVYFGILQLLGACMMLCAAIGSRGAKLFSLPAAAAWLALFFITEHLCGEAVTDIRWLYPLGLKYEGFYSADYYPIFPWGFLFMTGACLGEEIKKYPDSALFNMRFPKWATFCGRNSLIIYLLHQPLIYGIFLMIFKK